MWSADVWIWTVKICFILDAVLRQNMQYAYKPVSAGTKFQQAKKINLKFIDL